MIAEEVKTQRALSGSVLVVEVATGKIRAAAEYPVVDPNEPAASRVSDRTSRMFTDAFEPGSTYKIVTAAAVMEAGGVTPLSTVSAAGREVFPNGAVITDFTPHGTLEYTLAGALIDSSNVAMSKFGDKVSMQTRHDYLAAFGVGEPTAVGFIGERSGLLHPVSAWDNQSRYTTTFGQYFTVTTPQLAGVYQTIANGGVKVPLRLVESCTGADGTVVEPDAGEPTRVIKKKTADQLALMLENVASQGSLAKQTAVPGYRIAAKTGTAQKPGADGRYKAVERFTSIVGFAPADDPEYVVVVTLDEPRKVRSSAATAPAFQKAMTQVLKTYRVFPSDTPTDTSLPKTK
ncbi:peptidoglycan D,D-transpeptidase FtsI family protein [Microbacterium sp. NIBRBAC000506063]|uniref:peptidoglycan D,D-transpeptidase FtsI family protein n=1 Tax=Microbacterium sp. NIBRBAC000506063 TaxID=2734618 RepID=UPI002948C433|nr:penicillin-binding transpeptidase domain-containing protein [Microbacterium sp. NIBRBAC000506063]